MFYIECPQISPANIYVPQLFLAGGISGCPDWQSEMKHLLRDASLALFNPRRENFPMHDPNAAKFQIEWEHTHLAKSDAILFWFPKETVCPIVLFELGAWAYKGGKPIFVGVHPNYERRQDVEIQLQIERPEIQIVYSLQELASQVQNFFISLYIGI